MRLIDADAFVLKLQDVKTNCIIRRDVSPRNSCRWHNFQSILLFLGAVIGKLNDPDFTPTIEAEPVRHGRWEWRGGIPWCSNCGEMPPGYSYEGDVNTTPYCPNCGAKMDKEVDHAGTGTV